MKKKYLIISVVLFFLMACTSRRGPEYCRMSDKIVSQYIKDMRKHYGLYSFGSGGGFFECVNKIMVSFTLVGERNIDELRELTVLATEDLLKRFNSDEKIRPFLKNYPFTEKNIRIAIYLIDKEGKGIINKGTGKELLGSVIQSYGTLWYQIENEDKPFRQDVFEEPYRDAFNIVKNRTLEKHGE